MSLISLSDLKQVKLKSDEMKISVWQRLKNCLKFKAQRRATLNSQTCTALCLLPRQSFMKPKGLRGTANS